ncbi:response regulator transcription factor [Thermoflexibacter ruber]|uniref:DNA-binding response regulator, OmpR family, contains REC and winged-helix (WHTH) domain n=1 Tax=Thermoflexibacter ruber TaxID=1003 RepID=A0A1I2E4T7_9BACT|nr:response regulator transcription factor [Thermoflexibacter ruber]SFE87942.1 DNA-binding response regulator, OmpR family, contains REC and winged-helix (wHTH) domain [Thermoflexibacter ruber]
MQTNRIKILFAEDDLSLGFVTKDNLELQGYEVVHCENGQIAWETFQKDSFDICILDVMLPKLDGFNLAKQIRAVNQDVPILFLTAKSLKEDKLTGLRIGADDYITKPFSIEELVLKIEVFLKRSKVISSEKNHNTTFYLGNYIFDYANLTLIHGQEKQQLTQREADILNYFCQNSGKVLRRDEILMNIWGDDDYFIGRSLDVFISRLRKYLKNDPRISIENIHSVGFKMLVKE